MACFLKHIDLLHPDALIRRCSCSKDSEKVSKEIWGEITMGWVPWQRRRCFWSWASVGKMFERQSWNKGNRFGKYMGFFTWGILSYECYNKQFGSNVKRPSIYWIEKQFKGKGSGFWCPELDSLLKRTLLKKPPN